MKTEKNKKPNQMKMKKKTPCTPNPFHHPVPPFVRVICFPSLDSSSSNAGSLWVKSKKKKEKKEKG